MEASACRVLDSLISYATELGCYKIILDCAEKNVAFYEKCGLVRKEVQMVRCPQRQLSP